MLKDIVDFKSFHFIKSVIDTSMANNYYVFYNRVNIYSLNKEVNLQEIINVESFRKINSYYFEDSEFIYFVPQNPTGSYFNILDKKENIKFSKNKDTIYNQYGIFYKGNLVIQKLSTKNKTRHLLSH